MPKSAAVPNPRPDRLSIVRVGQAASLFLAISFVFCIALGLIWPPGALHTPWLAFFPGVTWISVQSVFLGVVEAAAYGWYIALVFVPLYNRGPARRTSGA